METKGIPIKDRTEEEVRAKLESHGEYVLQQFLSRLAGKSLLRQRLREVMELSGKAWASMQKLIESRRKGLMADIWFALIMNAFMMDDVADQAVKSHMVALYILIVFPYLSRIMGNLASGGQTSNGRLGIYSKVDSTLILILRGIFTC